MLPCLIKAQIIHVPADQSNIQLGIDVANSGVAYGGGIYIGTNARIFNNVIESNLNQCVTQHKKQDTT